MKIKISLIVISFLFVNSAFAVSALNQFMSFHNSIHGHIVELEAGKVTVESIAAGNLRQKLFAIQSLAKFYTNQYRELLEVEKKTKGLEDQIGAYRKSGELLSAAITNRASQDKIDMLTKANNQALLVLKSYFETTGWGNSKGGELAKIKAILENIRWSTEVEEQNYAYRALTRQVDILVKTPWNMDVLEGGTGIHDLRKQVRWYKLQMETLNSIIGSQNVSCDQGAIHPSDPKSGGKCLVSSCLNQRVIQSYDFFGNIKDEGEAAEGVGGHLNPGKFKEAKKFYEALRNDQIFEKMSAEIASCTTK